MFRSTAGLTALVAFVLAQPAAAAPRGGGHGHGGAHPSFAPSFAPARTFSPARGHSFSSGLGQPSRIAVSFSLRLTQNPILARNLFFFGRSSPFGLSGGWVTPFNRFAFPSFVYGYALGFYQPLGSIRYSSQYAPPVPRPGPALPAQEEPPSEELGRAVYYAQLGEFDFHKSRYDQAVLAWRHALVEKPNNGGLVLLLAQALFQTGNFAEAAGAVQHGLGMLPQDQWNVVVGKYARLYGVTGDYTANLHLLEKASKDKPKDAALHFLLGYHYAYLGYPKEAVRELDEALKLAPGDTIARKIRDTAAAKLKPPLVTLSPQGRG